jgi:hypothetical protein
MRSGAILLLGGVLLGGVACSDNLPNPDTDECTAARITAAYNQCAFHLVGDIAPNTPCLNFAGAQTALMAGNYAVRACQEQLAGRWLTCVADNVAQCAYEIDAGVPNSVADQCLFSVNPAAVTPDPTCAQMCSSARQTCENMCGSRTTAAACFDCSFACGTAQVTCLNACPAADAGM